MAQEIGLLDLQHLLHQGTEPGWLEGISQYLPDDIEILEVKNGLEVLDFIENHKRLIVIDPDSEGTGNPMLYGEVAYWGQYIGGMPEEIIVLATHSEEKEAVAAQVLKCLKMC